MPAVTYYVALPFIRTDDGTLVAGEAQEKQSASAVVRAAQRMAEASPGAVAFSRTGDPSTLAALALGWAAFFAQVAVC